MGKKIFIAAIAISLLTTGGIFAAGYVWPVIKNKTGNLNSTPTNSNTPTTGTKSNVTTTVQAGQTQALGTTTTNTNSIAVKYDIAMVGRHNSSQDCWLIIHGNIYNVTTFINVHPGGVRAIADYCGQDATAAFDGLPHSAFANSLLKNFAFAKLNDVATPDTVSSAPKQLPTSTLQNLKGGDEYGEREGREDDEGGEW